MDFNNFFPFRCNYNNHLTAKYFNIDVTDHQKVKISKKYNFFIQNIKNIHNLAELCLTKKKKF